MKDDIQFCHCPICEGCYNFVIGPEDICEQCVKSENKKDTRGEE